MKRFISLLLTAFLVLSVCAMPALAATTQSQEAEEYIITYDSEIAGKIVDGESNPLLRYFPCSGSNIHNSRIAYTGLVRFSSYGTEYQVCCAHCGSDLRWIWG